MSIENITTILLSSASVLLGALLGVLRSKIFALKNTNSLHYFFYAISIIVFLGSILSLFLFWKEYNMETHRFALYVLITATISSISLFIVTKFHLASKDIYKTSELDKIVNNFTSNADKKNIKLLGGDLNFFGEHPAQIDQNDQYIDLKSHTFKKVSILCETPHNNTQKIRYGKILYELQGAELRFYNPDAADLRVRGRIIQVTGVDKLLMYTKISSGIYRAIETDTANSNGALYNNIWELVWSLAHIPTNEQNQSYINMFRGGGAP